LVLKVIEFKNSELKIIDQSALPDREVFISLREWQDVAESIEKMKVRGAPAIGIAAAYGYCLGFLENKNCGKKKMLEGMLKVKKGLLSSRPTAVNLQWALERMEERLLHSATEYEREDIYAALVDEANSIKKEQLNSDKKISRNGSRYLRRVGKNLNVLTHCNAGAMATGGWGTALGVIKNAYKEGIIRKVYAGETRPRMQGAKITCYELNKKSVEHELICDTAPGYLMYRGMIDAVITGADRIALNGDVANKIGTYQLAALADRNSIPFFIAAPVSSFDFEIDTGEEINVEYRCECEVLKINGMLTAPEGTRAVNPAFDITPADLIHGYVTEKGVIKKPDELQ